MTVGALPFGESLNALDTATLSENEKGTDVYMPALSSVLEECSRPSSPSSPSAVEKDTTWLALYRKELPKTIALMLNRVEKQRPYMDAVAELPLCKKL